MRKLILILLASFLFQLNASAQTKTKHHIIKFGGGNAFHNNDLTGTYRFGEYDFFLGKRISLSSVVGHHSITNSNTEPLQKLNAWQGDLGINFSLISTDNNNLKIGAGVNYRMGDKTFNDPLEANPTISSFDTKGWNAKIGYDIYVVKTVVIGTQFSFHQFENGDSNYFFGLNAGIRF